jgi:SAM-dependent methyltransferase
VDGWRGGVFMVLQRVARGLELASKALAYLAAGVLRPADLGWAIAQVWEDFGHTESHVLSGLMPWEQEFYSRFLKPDDEILIVGCGSGRDLLALHRAGHSVEGLEAADRAAALARATLEKHGRAVPVTTGRIEDAALGKPFDAYIFSWFCYSYIPQRQTRIAALRRAREHLRPGGRILISYLVSDAPPRRLPRALTALVARLARSGWRPEPTDVISPGNPGIHFEHQFCPDELATEARAAGLGVVFDQRKDHGMAVLTRLEPSSTLTSAAAPARTP